MSQHEERAKAILRIRKLQAQTITSGRTEAEVNMAMDKMQQLLIAFDIKMSEVDLREEPCIQIEIDSGCAKSDARSSIVVAIGRYLNCRAWRRTARQGQPNTVYCFFGMESDTLMADHLFVIVSHAFVMQTKIFMRSDVYNAPGPRGCKRRRLVSFQQGLGMSVNRKLKAMTDEKNTAIDANYQGSTSLVTIKSQRVEEEFAKIGMRLYKNYTGRRVRDFTSQMAGGQAGDYVNLNRPIGNNTDTLALTHG